MRNLDSLRIKLFADGAGREEIAALIRNPWIKGVTTNPTLMKKVGVTDYETFARELLETVKDKPISFEVIADDFAEMERQALRVSSWGKNVYVKIPVTNTKSESAVPLIGRLSKKGVKLNVTALMTLEQVKDVGTALAPETPSVVSVFAGRIADTGVDPVPLMKQALEILKPRPKAELLWASPRELLNILQADAIGCHIITATPDILNKLTLVGKDLKDYSLDTVKMFFNDAQKAGYVL